MQQQEEGYSVWRKLQTFLINCLFINFPVHSLLRPWLGTPGYGVLNRHKTNQTEGVININGQIYPDLWHKIKEINLL